MALKIEDAREVSFAEAREQGLDSLVDEGKRRPIAIVGEGGHGVIVVSIDTANQVMAALEMRDDIYDMVLALTRQATDTGGRHRLEDVIKEFGLTQAEIDAAD